MDKVLAEALRNRINKMIKDVSNLPRDKQPNGVNWGDISVRDVCGEISYLHGGGVQIFVDVEEAAPECGHFFTERLNEPGIVIRCEW